MHRAALVVTAAAAGMLSACSSSGPETAPVGGGTAVPAATSAGLPFTYQGSGESSSPTFHVATAGSYAVSWTLTGSQAQPNCPVNISLVADDGSNQMLVPGVQLAPSDTKSDSTTVQLSAGNWRFQEGGGCNWKVTVSLP